MPKKRRTKQAKMINEARKALVRTIIQQTGKKKKGGVMRAGLLRAGGVSRRGMNYS